MSDKETNFVSHLTELRQRLIHSLIFLFILFGISYYFSDHIYGFLVEPYASAVKNDDIERRLIFTALQETFMTYIKVSFFATTLVWTYRNIWLYYLWEAEDKLEFY